MIRGPPFLTREVDSCIYEHMKVQDKLFLVRFLTRTCRDPALQTDWHPWLNVEPSACVFRAHIVRLSSFGVFGLTRRL